MCKSVSVRACVVLCMCERVCLCGLMNVCINFEFVGRERLRMRVRERLNV